MIRKSDTIARSERLILSGQHDEAIRLLTKVLSDDPLNLPALLNIGIAYTEKGDHEAAIEVLENYVAQDPDNDGAFEALGCAYLRTGHYPEAEASLEAALQINPQSASVLRNLSIVLNRTRRGARGFVLLEHAYELDPDDYLTTYALAITYRCVGRAEDARQLYMRLHSLENVPTDIIHDAQKSILEMSLNWR